MHAALRNTIMRGMRLYKTLTTIRVRCRRCWTASTCECHCEQQTPALAPTRVGETNGHVMAMSVVPDIRIPRASA